jgi:hypothetical protein
LWPSSPHLGPPGQALQRVPSPRLMPSGGTPS